MPGEQTARISRLVVTLCMLAAVSNACTGDGEGGSRREGQVPSAASVAVDFTAPSGDALPRGVRLGDQSDQALHGVAASDEVVVAVGSDESANVVTPLFLTSLDRGLTWTRSTEEGAPSADEWPHLIAFGNDTFIAIGYANDGRPAVWASADGGKWTRHPTDRQAFKSTDSVSGIRYVDDAFYLTGATDTPRGASTAGGLLWTSDDGTSWQRVDLRRHGLGKLGGEAEVADMAVTDGQVVLAMNVTDRTRGDQPDRIEIWRSRDRMRSFRRDPTIPSFAGSYRAYAQGLIMANEDLVLAASGDGLSENTWDGVLMTSPAGSSAWTMVAPPALSTAGEEHPSVVLLLDNVYLVAANLTDTNDAVVAAGSGLEALRAVRHRSLRGRAEQIVADGASLGREAILVGSTGASGSKEAAIWRYADGSLRQVRLPKEARGGRASAYLNDVLATDDGFVGVGLSAESPVAWISDDFEGWEARGLTGRSTDVTTAWGRALANLADDGVVAVGALVRPLGLDAAVWVRDGDGHWHTVEDPALTLRNENGYGAVEPRDVAANGRAVVIAATAYVDGRQEAHPLVGSADGRAWSIGVGTRWVPLTTDETALRRTPYPAFRASDNGSVEMNAVTSTGRTFVIGGARGEPGRGTKAVVWRSRDGEVWSDPTTLPRMPGYHSASLSAFATLGDTLIGVGDVQKRPAETETGWASWISADGGVTWERGDVVAPRRAHAYQVISIPGGFLAMGATGPDSDLEAAAWTSPDGRGWTPIDLGIEAMSGPGRQVLVDGIVDGHRLQVVGSNEPPGGGGYYAASVDLPLPDGD
jgi:hypothetical protein